MLVLATIAAVLGYVVLVEKLRFRRKDFLTSKHPYHDRQSLARMTLEDAYEIQLSLAELEFPFTFSTSIFFALFKVGSHPHSIIRGSRRYTNMTIDLWHTVHIQVVGDDRGARASVIVIQKGGRHSGPAH